MSPQFVDFDADGKLDIVAGTFDGSPHVAVGTSEGWKQPEQILDASGARIVFNQFWNHDTSEWDDTKRCDAKGAAHGHLTSAVAFDWDDDGDLDLLLGDHVTGRIYRRMNEGTSKKPAFAAKNLVVPGIDVPGTVATLRLIDWNKDGLMDLLVGGMGQYDGGGGGVFVLSNTGSKSAPAFEKRITLVAAGGHAGHASPVRPDSGYYIDAADFDGDGDLDLVVGGYSNWTANEPALSAEQKARVPVLRHDLEECQKATQAIYDAMEKSANGTDAKATRKAQEEFLTAHREELSALSKRRKSLDLELDPLVGGAKRHSYVWLYENTEVNKQAQVR